jgi:hypothetical protein
MNLSLLKRLINQKSLLMKVLPTRVVVYTKDVSNITGLGPRAARKLLSSIRKQLNKPKSSFITIEEFSVFTGIKEDLVRSALL